MATSVDAGIRISDSSMLVECENDSKWQYKYVVYDNISTDKNITDVFAIGKIDKNVEDYVDFQCKRIADFINETKEIGYDNKQYVRKILSSFVKNTSYILAEYNPTEKEFLQQIAEI